MKIIHQILSKIFFSKIRKFDSFKKQNPRKSSLTQRNLKPDAIMNSRRKRHSAIVRSVKDDESNLGKFVRKINERSYTNLDEGDKEEINICLMKMPMVKGDECDEMFLNGHRPSIEIDEEIFGLESSERDNSNNSNRDINHNQLADQDNNREDKKSLLSQNNKIQEDSYKNNKQEKNNYIKEENYIVRNNQSSLFQNDTSKNKTRIKEKEILEISDNNKYNYYLNKKSNEKENESFMKSFSISSHYDKDKDNDKDNKNENSNL